MVWWKPNTWVNVGNIRVVVPTVHSEYHVTTEKTDRRELYSTVYRRFLSMLV